MTYFLYFSAILCGLLRPKSKLVTIYIMAAMYLLAAFNYSNADYGTYVISYSSSAGIAPNFRYIGYTLLMRTFSTRGWEYSQYLKLVFAIIFLLLFISIRLLTDRANQVFACFMIFSYGTDVVQVKHFTAETLALLGIAMMLYALCYNEILGRSKTLFTILTAFLCEIISSLLHFACVFYTIVCLFFLLIKNKDKIQKKVFNISLFMIVFTYFGFISTILNVSANLGFIAGMDYLSHYAAKSTNLGFLISYAGVFLFWKACQSKNALIVNSVSIANKQIVIKHFLSTVILLLPLLLLTITYDRLLRVYFILMYIYFANAEKCILANGRLILSKSTGLFIAAIAYFFYIDIAASIDGTLWSILQYSELF